uniref:Ribonuclease H-like domain-containing protein n=1 Tax=Tanacetum cinerariifolium TaxID=118510 RepID=A0A699HDJ8_TANCI|nr:ribonuclease H-like domain-containing protein [Tanacetum cinerariifolium]
MGGDDENATNQPQVPPTPQAPHTLSTIKLPIMKKGEYDIYAIKMEHYLEHTDYLIWEVIQKGNEGLQKSYDRFQGLLSQLKIHGAGVSTEDVSKKFLRNQLALTRPKLSALIATIHDTLLESADQKEIKKVEGEMQEILDTKQETIGGDLQTRMNIKLWSLLMEKVLIRLVMLNMTQRTML